MKFNKKLRNDSQENRVNQKYLKYNNSDENDHICTDCQYSKYKECKYQRDLHSMPKKYMNNIRNTENDEKKYFVKFNPNKKYNGISTTNYTNTDTPKNTTKTAFHGRQQTNNSRLKVYSRKLTKNNNKYN